MQKVKIIEDAFPELYRASGLYAIKEIDPNEAEEFTRVMRKITNEAKVLRNDELKLVVVEGDEIAIVIAAGDSGSTAYLLIKDASKIENDGNIAAATALIVEAIMGFYSGMGWIATSLLAITALVVARWVTIEYKMGNLKEKYREVFEMFDHQ